MFNLSRDAIWPDFSLVDPFNMDTKRIIKNIVDGIHNENKRLKKSVLEFFQKLLIPVEELISQNVLLPETKERLQCCFKDIYLSLKVHVMFYRRIDKKLTKTEDEVRNLGSRSAKQTKQLPNQASEVYPESKASRKVGREATRKKFKIIDHKQVF